MLGIAIGCQAYSGYADFNVGGIYYKILSTDNGEKTWHYVPIACWI